MVFAATKLWAAFYLHIASPAPKYTYGQAHRTTLKRIAIADKCPVHRTLEASMHTVTHSIQ
jgi:hypothetical protein